MSRFSVAPTPGEVRARHARRAARWACWPQGSRGRWRTPRRWPRDRQDACRSCERRSDSRPAWPRGRIRSGRRAGRAPRCSRASSTPARRGSRACRRRRCPPSAVWPSRSTRAPRQRSTSDMMLMSEMSGTLWMVVRPAQQRGGDQLERRVLRARHGDVAGQRVVALYDDDLFSHGSILRARDDEGPGVGFIGWRTPSEAPFAVPTIIRTGRLRAHHHHNESRRTDSCWYRNEKRRLAQQDSEKPPRADPRLVSRLSVLRYAKASEKGLRIGARGLRSVERFRRPSRPPERSYSPSTKRLKSTILISPPRLFATSAV